MWSCKFEAFNGVLLFFHELIKMCSKKIVFVNLQGTFSMLKVVDAWLSVCYAA